MNSFKYSAKTINKLIEEYNLNPVCMKGTQNELENLKSYIEEFYDKYIFYLSYWKGDAPYHGWLWSEDDGRMANQAKITDGITDKFYEIYALILSGLGERCENDEI